MGIYYYHAHQELTRKEVEMLKKLLLVFGLMSVLSVVPMAMAQLPANNAEVVAAFEKEGPLTQKDIDGYLQLISKMKGISSESEVLALFKDAGFTEARGSYVSTKTSLTLVLVQLGDQADAFLSQNKVHDVLKPSKDEIELVKKNMDKIQKAAAGQ